MACYVDDVRHGFGRMVMCHLWADTYEELLAMVDAIGVQRKWLQQPPKASWVHFDISLTKKAEAIARGAILTDQYGPVLHTAKLRAQSSDPNTASFGRKMIELVESNRAKFKTKKEPDLFDP